MANRTMQAKALKLQRQLRKLPKKMPDEPVGTFEKHSKSPIPARLLAEGVKAPRSPNRELMGGYKHRAKSLKTSMEEANEAAMRKQGDYFINKPPGRLEAEVRATELRLKEMEADSPEMRRLLCVMKFAFRRG